MLIPGTVRHYRVDSEFEDLDDLELELLIFQAKQRRDDAIWVLPLLAVLATWIGVIGPVAWLATKLTRNMSSARPASAPAIGAGSASLSFAGASVIALIAVAGLAASVVVWLWFRRWLVIRSIRRILRKASCPFCAFDLRGLPVTEQQLVRCPECGELLILSDFGITKRDLALDDGFVPPAPVSAYEQRNAPASAGPAATPRPSRPTPPPPPPSPRTETSRTVDRPARNSDQPRNTP